MTSSASSAASSTVEDPYVGLTHFTEDRADRFFGRNSECAVIMGNLRAARMTLLYAESGVGKSSVLRAGVVARLRGLADRDVDTRGSPRFVPVIFSAWADRPVAGLIRAIGEAIGPYLPTGTEVELPEDDLEGAIEAVNAALDTTLLVVLDQFEEYSFYPDPSPEGEGVADQVARCVDRRDLRANFLISIREDAYSQLGDLFRGKVANVYGNFIHLDFLDRAGAREAIEKPIERINELHPDAEPYGIEPALVDAVLDQVARGRITVGADDQGNTEAAEPNEDNAEVETTYLQLVMRRLWEAEAESGSHLLRLQTLKDLGEAQAIIGTHLDRAMGSEADGGAVLTDEQRLVAASIFRFLVTSGGTKIALTAKDLSDSNYTGRSEAEIDPVLQHLSSPQLHILRPIAPEDGHGEPLYEIFHDALARPIVEWRTRTEEAQRDARLKRERERKEKAERAAADAEAREAAERKRKQMALGLLALAVIALLGGVIYFAFNQANLADQRKQTAQSVQVAERLPALAAQPDFGPAATALASVEDYRLSPTFEARNQTLAMLQLNPGLPHIAVGHTRGVNDVEFLPGSDRFVSGASDGTVRLWTAAGQQIGPPLVNHERSVLSVAVGRSPDAEGTRILAAGLGNSSEDKGEVRLWTFSNAGKFKVRGLIAETRGSIYSLAFNPLVPGLLAVGSRDRTVSLWNVKNPGRPIKLGTRRAAGAVFGLSFVNRALLAATEKGAQGWRLSVSGLPAGHPITFSHREELAVATTADGSYAVGGTDGVIDLWDAHRERESHLRLSGEVEALAFNHQGSVLVAAGGRNVTTWEVATGRPFGPVRVHEETSVRGVAVSSDDTTIASAGDEFQIKLWPFAPDHALATTIGGLSPGEAEEANPPLPVVYDLAVGSDHRVAAAAGPAGTTLWAVEDRNGGKAAPRPLTSIPGESYAVAYHRNLLAVGRGRGFAIYDTGSSCPSMPTRACPIGSPAQPHSRKTVRAMAFARYDNRLILATSGEGEPGRGLLNLWAVNPGSTAENVEHLSTRSFAGTVPPEGIALSPASPTVAVGADDGKLRVWDIEDPTHPVGLRFEGAQGNEGQAITAVAFSPDGSRVATGGQDQRVVLWEVFRNDAGGLTVRQTPGGFSQSQTIFALAFSPDGKTLAAADGDASTCLYDVEIRQFLGSEYCLLGHISEDGTGSINSIKFAAAAGGGTRLLTAGTGQPIVAWNSILWNRSDDARSEQALAANVCAMAGRNLTEYEWSAAFDATQLADHRRQTCPQFPLR